VNQKEKMDYVNNEGKERLFEVEFPNIRAF
jgi:hypothetical protein